jgi:glycosyltransferase involved in cell wall biosynthesis
MRILVVHNQYQQRGGEDSVVESEVALLRAHGHEVDVFLRDNADIARLSTAAVAAGTVWARDSAARLGGILDAFRPDLVHMHNTFPLISPAAYWVAHRRGVPVVQTLHNFRLLCPQAMLLREGKVCEACVGRLPWRAVAHGCYQGSPVRSAGVVAMIAVHRAIGTWRDRVARYIALNDFCRRRFIEGGLPAQRISVKPNFVDCAAPAERPREGFLFVGRLSPEKGVDVLARAIAQVPGATLRVAGTGPSGEAVAAARCTTMLGALSGERVLEEMTSSLALVLPSIWYENFPRTLVEAFASGLPVVASRLGAMAELVEDGRTGLLFEPGSAEDLAVKLRWAQAHPERMRQMGRQARAVYEARYTPGENYRQLRSIYEEVLAEQAPSTASHPSA